MTVPSLPLPRGTERSDPTLTFRLQLYCIQRTIFLRQGFTVGGGLWVRAARHTVEQHGLYGIRHILLHGQAAVILTCASQRHKTLLVLTVHSKPGGEPAACTR